MKIIRTRKSKLVDYKDVAIYILNTIQNILFGAIPRGKQINGVGNIIIKNEENIVDLSTKKSEGVIIAKDR